MEKGHSKRKTPAHQEQDPRRHGTTPLQEDGRLLCTLRRSPDEEIRISWREYNGWPYLSFRVWHRNRQSRWWADPKRGFSVRLRDLEDVRAALEEATSLAEKYRERLRRDRNARPAAESPRRDRSPHPRCGPADEAQGESAVSPPWDTGALPAGTVGPADKFNEF
jgi:hypothetical protein